jgi:hypothetical protein
MIFAEGSSRQKERSWAENERQSQEIKLLKEKIDLLIRRLFGSEGEKLDAAQLVLLLNDLDLGKAVATTLRTNDDQQFRSWFIAS